MLDNRNFTAFPGFPTIMDAALNFEVGPGWVHNFNQLFFVDNAFHWHVRPKLVQPSAVERRHHKPR